MGGNNLYCANLHQCSPWVLHSSVVRASNQYSVRLPLGNSLSKSPFHLSFQLHLCLCITSIVISKSSANNIHAVLFFRRTFLQVGDEILEINGRSTENIPHADAIALIKSGGNRVRLLIHRSNKPLYHGKLCEFAVHRKTFWPNFSQKNIPFFDDRGRCNV